MSANDPRHELGREGERLAERHLRGLGYQTIARQYSTPVGELDLVMRDRDTVVFVEVKTRGDRKFAEPEDAITREKRRRLVRAARWYLERSGDAERPCRFDVVSIILPQSGEPQIRHHLDAFDAEHGPR